MSEAAGPIPPAGTTELGIDIVKVERIAAGPENTWRDSPARPHRRRGRLCP
jgi:hypothetical protein